MTITATDKKMEQPSVDKREYRHCQVGTGKKTDDNAEEEVMDVLLISDPETDKASAAMDVHVGQLNDPLPGLAHFCEHMLFIGTQKYPNENAYDKYLSEHGGSSNAFTDLEHTCYYFDVQAGDLEGALDRFAQCFIAPLFTQSALEREVQAVDSEHHKNLQQDMWRMFQLSKTRLVGTKDDDDNTPLHPYGSFGSGNQESLPIEHIREQLLEFYQTYYRKSLSLYKLVVLGKESLDDLQSMVERYFDELAIEFASCHAKRLDDILTEWFPPVSKWQVPQRLHVVPVSQVHALELQFPMAPQWQHWQHKPTRYLSHLLGHEGQGSLLSLLKEKHYALELYADDSSKSCRAWNIFTIRLELTDTGLEHVNDVLQHIFAYLDLLRTEGPKDWIQTELRTVGDLQFRFLSQRNPMDYTCSLAGIMQQYPPTSYLSGPYTVRDWNPAAVSECLTAVIPDNCFVVVSSPTFEQEETEGGEDKTNKTTLESEKWYGTKYQSVPIDESLLTQWRTAKASDYPELQLPQVNDMVATEFALVPESLRSIVPEDAPLCLALGGDDDDYELWYKPDNVFTMPKINGLWSFASGVANASADAVVLTQVFVEFVEEQVNEFTYLASMAGLHCELGLTHGSGGIEMQVTGYHHKAHVLVERLMERLLQTSLTDQEDKQLVEAQTQLMERILFKLEQQFQSFLVAQPYQHAIYGSDQVLEHATFSIPQKLVALQQLASSKSPLELVLQHATRLWKDCRLTALVHGNVTPEQAKSVTQKVWDQIQARRGSSPASTSTPRERRVVQLAPGSSTLYRFEEFNEANTNSCTQIVLQMGSLPLKDNATLAFVHHLIREPAFNQLRTEEQLGYIVHTSIKTSGDNIKGLLFLIQSDSFDPIHVEGRIEAFLSTMRVRIQSMTVEEFATNVNAVVASFLEKNKNLGEESSRYWHVMMNKSYQFRRLQEVAEHVKEITKDQVLQFFDKYVAALAPCRRKLCVQVFAKPHHDKMKESSSIPEGVVVIEDPFEFKRSMPLYPLPKKVEISITDALASTD